MLTPIEDSACAGNCYTPCGEVYHEEGLTNTGDDVTLRFFFLQLGDITKYVGPTTKRVFVYAQTVLVDRSVDFKFSLLVRTKQLIMDRSKVGMTCNLLVCMLFLESNEPLRKPVSAIPNSSFYLVITTSLSRYNNTTFSR